jgi:hypothetical protein
MEPTTPQVLGAPAPKPSIAPAPVSKWLTRGAYSDAVDDRKLHILCYGHPKSGKTTFMGTFPGLVVIDADNGLVTLRGQKIFGFVPQKGEQNFKDVMDFLLDIKLKRNDFAPGGPLGYEVQTVGLDTITRLSELIKIDTMLHPIKGATADINYVKADYDIWGFTQARLGSIVDLLNSLPLHTVVNAWVTLIEDDTTGTKMGLPKTEGKYREVMAGRFDEVYYSYAQAGNPTKYYIRTTPYSYYIGGSRLGLPPQIENPSFALLQEALKKGSK